MRRGILAQRLHLRFLLLNVVLTHDGQVVGAQHDGRVTGTSSARDDGGSTVVAPHQNRGFVRSELANPGKIGSECLHHEDSPLAASALS